MEEFEHLVVEEFNEEDFYETIEAPKFVDLTAPDHRPEGDDRFWFCSRVGCDQKHEEFMDSEVIYKNFVLRVMAARSPSVRLRKALYRKDFSVDPKCPNTVPAKPSRSRVSKLAMISSMPQKTNDNNIKVKTIPTNKNATTPKGNKSLVPRKVLTEGKKQMQSPAGFFRSVQNTKTGATVKRSETRVVAKALVFNSPKKVVKLKRSVELSSSVKKLCNGVRKLEIENKRNGLVGDNNKVQPSKRPLRVREVKSRVFDSLRSHKQMDEKAKLKVKAKAKAKEESVVSTDTELGNKSVCCPSSGDEVLLVENKSEEISKTLKTKDTDDKENAYNAKDEDRDDFSVTKDKAKRYDATVANEEKENVTNAADADRESDDKENSSSALDNNRKVPLLKSKVFGKKETCKTTQKVMATKCFNGANNTCVKYTKPKLTNPKPFRLRTDERRILKEANTEKKTQCDLAKGEETRNILRLEKKTPSKCETMVNRKRVALGASKTSELMNGASKRHATVPKGPNFHTIHVPKSCTKRMPSSLL